MKRVHYEVRGAHGPPLKCLTLPTARNQAAWLAEPGRLSVAEVSAIRIVRITVEDVPLRAKKVRR